ncbi:glycosyltransferase [Caulobacter soli]|uniref:glycosyltransferase n=1 Tax=Caulobacter soli TaxID=2708539 RepID=UPI0013ED01DC|nr:glycosyltransferase [Caulobacter soli]
MRIVMLTDDSNSIDRRILLEADALIAKGHEVILLARHLDGLPDGARINELKVAYVKLSSTWLAKPSVKGLVIGFARRMQAVAKTCAKGAVRTRLSRLKSIILRLYAWLVAVRASPEVYLRRDFARVFDSWTPLPRRAMIAGRLLAAGAMGLALEIARFVRRPRRGLKFAGPSHLAHPMKPHAWDQALIDWATYYDPDLIHAHDLPQLFAGVTVARKLGVPLIYDAHEVYPEISSLTAAEKTFLLARESALVKHCDALITVNPFCGHFMEKRYGSKPFEVITNATERTPALEANPRPRRFHEKLGLPADVRVLCYQGWFSKEGRGLAELVAAMADVREDVHLVMIGYGDREYFRGIAERSGCTERVHILDAVPWTELLEWSASADVGIIPYQPIDFNHKFCSPNKLYEFIAARLPILANDLVYLRQVIEGEGFGMVAELTNPANMAAAINTMFDPETDIVSRSRQDMIAKGPAWEWPVEAEKLLAIYDRVIARSPDKGLRSPVIHPRLRAEAERSTPRAAA